MMAVKCSSATVTARRSAGDVHLLDPAVGELLVRLEDRVDVVALLAERVEEALVRLRVTALLPEEAADLRRRSAGSSSCSR